MVTESVTAPGSTATAADASAADLADSAAAPCADLGVLPELLHHQLRVDLRAARGLVVDEFAQRVGRAQDDVDEIAGDRLLALAHRVHEALHGVREACGALVAHRPRHALEAVRGAEHRFDGLEVLGVGLERQQRVDDALEVLGALGQEHLPVRPHVEFVAHAPTPLRRARRISTATRSIGATHWAAPILTAAPGMPHTTEVASS